MSQFPCTPPANAELCRVVMIPGPAGRDADPCVPCQDGANAYGTLTLSFVVPAIGGTVIVEVDSTAWMVPQEGTVYGQALAIEFAGTFLVAAIIDSSRVTLYNPGYTGNAVAGTTIPVGARIGVSGVQGTGGGGTPTGALLAANNLSDLVSPPTGRTNLGLGDSATHPAADFLLAVQNLADVPTKATARTNLGLAIGTNVQAFSAFLTGLAAAGPGVADQAPYLTAANTWALFATTAAMRALLASASNTALLATLKLFPRVGLIGSLIGADMNSILDQAIPINSTAYRVTGIMAVNADVNMTTAQGGVYNAVGKPGGGILVAAAQAYTALTASPKYLDLTLAGVALTDIQTAGSIYLSLTTPQGAAATCDFYVFGQSFS